MPNTHQERPESLDDLKFIPPLNDGLRNPSQYAIVGQLAEDLHETLHRFLALFQQQEENSGKNLSEFIKNPCKFCHCFDSSKEQNYRQYRDTVNKGS